MGLQLRESAPNPFRSETSIGFSLPQTGHVTLRIIDAQDRLVRALVDGPADAGRHQLTWDGRDDAGRPLPDGVYFVDLVTPTGRRARKAIAIE